MAGDAARVADMRGGANRAFGLALLASVLLHALVLAALPSLQSLVVEVAHAPQPLVAHLAQPPAPPPAPPPATPPATPPAPATETRPPPSSAARQPVRPRAAVPAPAPMPVQPPAAEPAPPPPAAPVTPAAAGPLVRFEPLPPPPPAPPPEEDARAGYRDRVSDAAARFKIYPRAAIDNNWEGEVVVLMRIGADGRIAGLHVRKSSGYEILDRQALEMFRNAKPFVPLPRALGGREFEVELRAIYSLRDQGPG